MQKHIVLGLQDEIRCSEESRYDHRLHGVLLVAQGLTCPEVSWLLGGTPRTIEYWVRRFKEKGLSGLVEGDRFGGHGRRPVGWQRIGRLYQEAVSGELGRPPVPIHI